ncbi:hypothetical protein [Spartinivicinus ruber]|uniref:hypothetical protein n=1 Tax=Spartinivicinus ruber TaxID=2683272 RepID=UPI0013D31308|nr:hypothetical protein [Spartinivicinus ruber]
MFDTGSPGDLHPTDIDYWCLDNSNPLITDSIIDQFGDQQLRASAMASALAWVEGEEITPDAFTEIISGMADVAIEDDITQPEEDYYEDLTRETAIALTALGAENRDVKTFIERQDEASALTIAQQIEDRLSTEQKDDGTLVAEYAALSQPVMDKAVRRVIDGKIVLKKIPTRKRRMTAAQKAALKKARRKAHSAAAKRARAKAMKLRSQRGL